MDALIIYFPFKGGIALHPQLGMNVTINVTTINMNIIIQTIWITCAHLAISYALDAILMQNVNNVLLVIHYKVITLAF